MIDILKQDQIIEVAFFSGTALPSDWLRPRRDADHDVSTTQPIVQPLVNQVVASGVSTSDLSSSALSARVLEWRSAPPTTGTKDTPFLRPKPNEQEFNIVISRLSRLLHDEDELHPTDYALRTALATIYEANQILRGVFVRAAVAVDEDGSIIFYWKSPAKNLNLTVPAQPGRGLHIYHREGSEYGGERNASAASLAQWLRWYMQV